MNWLVLFYILVCLLILILVISFIRYYIYLKKTNKKLIDINKDLIVSYNELLEKYKENNFYEQENKKIGLFNSYLEYIGTLKK